MFAIYTAESFGRSDLKQKYHFNGTDADQNYQKSINTRISMRSLPFSHKNLVDFTLELVVVSLRIITPLQKMQTSK